MKITLVVVTLFLFAIKCDARGVDSILVKKLGTYGLTYDFYKTWRKDSCGCLKLRVNYADELPANKKLIGMPFKDFIEIFGLPNREENSQRFRYNAFVDCENGKPIFISENFGFLFFYFEDGKLTGCVFVIS